MFMFTSVALIEEKPDFAIRFKLSSEKINTGIGTGKIGR